MRRCILALVGLCALLAAYAAAPALSLAPRIPAPVEFSQPVPAGGGPVRAPKRFDLVGVPGSDGSLEFRVRREGGRWSPWSQSDPGTPVWAGGADFVQVRDERGRVPRGRLFYVNVTGTSTPAQRLLTGFRKGVRAAVTPLLAIAGAQAQSGPEGTISREAWGAERCEPRSAPSYGEVRAAVVHHTVSANSYSAEEAPALVLGICRFHRNGNGWNDIGYNALVDRFGRIYEGRAGGLDRAVIGAQTAGFNSQTTGVASIGTHTSDPATPAAIQAIQRFLSWKLSVHGVPAQGRTALVSAGGRGNRFAEGREATVDRITGHRVLNSTSCPGDQLYVALGQIRGGVRSVPVQLISLTASVRNRVVIHPQRPVVEGRAVASDTGAPMGGATVRIDLKGRRGWRVLSSTTTDGEGRFAAALPLSSSRELRVRVLRVGAYRTATSPSLRVEVRPGINARLSAASTLERGGLARVIATTAPRKVRSALIVYRRSSGGYRRIARLARRYRGRTGRFVFDYRPRRAGAYRFFVYVARDRSNASGRSAVINATVRAASGGSRPDVGATPR